MQLRGINVKAKKRDANDLTYPLLLLIYNHKGLIIESLRVRGIPLQVFQQPYLLAPLYVLP
jgi:hypothetical protein